MDAIMRPLRFLLYSKNMRCLLVRIITAGVIIYQYVNAEQDACSYLDAATEELAKYSALPSDYLQRFYSMNDPFVKSFIVAGKMANLILKKRCKRYSSVTSAKNELNKLHKKVEEMANEASGSELFGDQDKKYLANSGTTRLEKSMLDLIKSPSLYFEATFFLATDERYPIMEQLRKIRVQLQNGDITKDMESDYLSSKIAFDKWAAMLKILVNKLTIAEHFYEGLTDSSLSSSTFNETNVFNLTDTENISMFERLRHRLIEQVEKYPDEHPIPYWDTKVKEIISQMEDEDMSNAQKADTIRDKLSRIFTRDEFYIVVYPEDTGFSKHIVIGEENQYHAFFRTGGSNIIVYRSKLRHRTNPFFLQEFASAVEALRLRRSINCCTETADLSVDAEEIANSIKDSGMVAIIGNENAEIRWTGPTEWGPGWWITQEYAVANSYLRHTVKIIVGYK